MAMQKLKEVSDKDLNDFSKICRPLVKYIRMCWNWKGLIPKGYKAFKDTYEDYETDPLAEKRAKKFDGIDSTSACGFGFHDKTALHHVCYDDVNQGRDPLQTLVSACVSFGMTVGEERHNRKIAKARESHNDNLSRFIGVGQLCIKTLQENDLTEERRVILLKKLQIIFESRCFKIDDWFGKH